MLTKRATETYPTASLDSCLSGDHPVICKIFTSNSTTPGDRAGKHKAAPEPMRRFTQGGNYPIAPWYVPLAIDTGPDNHRYKNQNLCLAFIINLSRSVFINKRYFLKIQYLGDLATFLVFPTQIRFAEHFLALLLFTLPAFGSISPRQLTKLFTLEHGNTNGTSQRWSEDRAFLCITPMYTAHPCKINFLHNSWKGISFVFITYSVLQSTLESPRPGSHKGTRVWTQAARASALPWGAITWSQTLSHLLVQNKGTERKKSG